MLPESRSRPQTCLHGDVEENLQVEVGAEAEKHPRRRRRKRMRRRRRWDRSSLNKVPRRECVFERGDGVLEELAR